MISIIIPLYRVEDYIERCLLSLEKQTFKDFEVIVVNDGSPDDSLSIVENYIEKTNLNIKIINQENSGVSMARNNGIKYITGEYVCFMDSDDMYDSEYLSTMHKEIVSQKADVCICRSHSIDESEDRIFSYQEPYTVEIFSKKSALEGLLYGRFSAGIWALLTRREILGDLKFAEHFRYSEDLEMVWRLVASSDKIVRIDAPLYCYRVRGGSAMSKVDDRRLDGLELFENLELFVKEKAPDFYPQYKSFGVARWVWSTVWQETLASNSYKEFCERVKKYQPAKYMRKLFKYKNNKVRISSFMFIYCRILYYFTIKQYKRKYRKLS